MKATQTPIAFKPMTIIFFSYPIWGTVLAFALIRSFNNTLDAQQLSFTLLFLLNLFSAYPIWKSKISTAAKVIRSLGFYLIAYGIMVLGIFIVERKMFIQVCDFG